MSIFNGADLYVTAEVVLSVSDFSPYLNSLIYIIPHFLSLFFFQLISLSRAV